MSSTTTRVSLAPRPPSQPTRKPIGQDSLNYVRSIVSTITKVEGCKLNQTVLGPIYSLLMGSETSDYIRDPAAIWILLELLPNFNHAVQMEVWQRLISIVGRSLRNIQMCCSLALIPHCLDIIKGCDDQNGSAVVSRIAEFIGTVTAYDVSVDELKMLIKHVTASDNQWPTHSIKLLAGMRMMTRRTCPEIMFNFSGDLGSAITIPPLARWPSNPGFTINLWVSFDPRFMLPSYKPFLYWFKTGKGLGYSGLVAGQHILLETVTGKGQITGKMTKTPTKVEKRLEPHTWYMITVVYVYHRMRNSELLCYINGRLAQRQDVGYVNTNEPFDKCYIGSSPRATMETSFCGQMSGVTLFSDVLNTQTISALYRLGSNYKHSFQHVNEHDEPIPAVDSALLYNGKLANSVVFSYYPKACNGQLCFEVSKTRGSGYFVNSSHAILLEGVETVATRNIHSTLHSLGGIQVVIPLFEQLYSCTNSTPELAATLVWLFVDLLKTSASCQVYVTANRSLLVISHLLSKCDKSFLSDALLEGLLSLGRTLVEIKHGPLLNSLINDVLLRTDLWIKTKVNVQIKLYSVISTEFVGNATSCDIKQSMSIPKIFSILRDSYWIEANTDTQPQALERDLTRDDVKSIRAFLLLSAKQSMMRCREVDLADISCILSYLISTPHACHILDVIQLLLALLCEHSSGVLGRFEELDGVKAITSLMYHEEEAIRLYALKTIAAYLNTTTEKQAKKVVNKGGIFSIVTQRLAESGGYITIATYNVLWEFAINHNSRQLMLDKHSDPDPDSVIHYPQILESIAILLLKEPIKTGDEDSKDNNIAICKQFLTTLLLILQRSRENRRVVIGANGWQRWLVGLLMKWGDEGSDGKHVTDLAYSLFQTLLHHALQWEQDGWLVWVETLAILHAHQSDGLGSPSTTVAGSEVTVIPTASGEAQYDSCKADDEASVVSELNHKLPEIKIESETPLPEPIVNGDCENEKVDDRISVKDVSDCEDVGEKEEEERSDSGEEDTQNGGRDGAVTAGSDDSKNKIVDDDDNMDKEGDENIDNAVKGGLKKSGSEEMKENNNKNLEKNDNTEKTGENINNIILEGKEINAKADLQNLESEVKENQDSSDSGVDEEDISHYEDNQNDVGSGDEDTQPDDREILGGSPPGEENEGTTLSNSSQVSEPQEDEVVDGGEGEPKHESKEDHPEDEGGQELEEEEREAVGDEEEEREDDHHVEEEEREAVGDEEEEREAVHENNSVSSEEKVRELTCTPIIDSSSRDEQESLDQGSSRDSEHGSCDPTNNPPRVEVELRDSEEEELVSDNMTSSGARKNSSGWPWDGYPFNPSQWRFKTMPPFKWSHPHQRLLSDLLVYLNTTMKLWRSSQKSTSDIVNARDNGVYMTNIAHLISLTADNLIVECGGVGKLVNEITVPGKASVDTYEPMIEYEKAFQLVQLLTSIVDTVVFCSVLNFSPVEAHRSLKQGGMLRICLRLVTCYSTIKCLKKRAEREEGQEYIPVESLMEEINSKLTPLGIVGEPLRQHLLGKLEQRHEELLHGDYLLDDKDIYYLRCCVMRDLDLYMKESEQQALLVLFYLSVLTVTQYHEILNKQRGGDNITQQVQRSLTHVGPLLNDLLLDFQGPFSKTILGTHGRELMNEGMACLKGEVPVVELAMQLCSQEWLSALERHAGVTFTKLLREGRHVASSTDEYLVKLAVWSENVASEAVAEHIVKNADFEMTAKRILSALLAEQQNTLRLILAQQRQNLLVGEKNWNSVLLFDSQLKTGDDFKYYRLDNWEDGNRRRYKLIFNPDGTSHPEATLHNEERTQDPASGEVTPVVVASKDSKEQELEAEGVDENDNENMADNMLFSETAKLLLPSLEIPGTLTITKHFSIFSADEEETKGAVPEDGNFKFYSPDVSAVFTRRYMHAYRAVEVFTIGHKSFFLVLSDYDAVKRAVAALPRVGIGLQYGLPARRQISLAHPKKLLMESNMMDKWRSREISNFDYLMFLNTIAGRSYNDLGQYPIFPWILKDFKSDKIDLADPGVYRDLSKPVGAQNADREARFREKFEQSKDGLAPPYHYGTHYSTPGFVLMWLLRVEPFTSLFLKLQSGKFDHPCRIFASLSQAWENCQRDMSDVKELIPELFYLPEMFTNSNKYQLGTDDDGVLVNHVTLPPWARDPAHFVEVHRKALESDYVSAHLHHWIDLIFGFQQRGEEAIKHCNSFYYTTYEGLCSPDEVEDPVIKEALTEQIRSFGQTPPQLLTSPHPARNSIQHIMNSNIKSLNDISGTLAATKESHVTLVKVLTTPVLHSSPLLCTVTANQTITLNKFIPSIQSSHHVFMEPDPAPKAISEPIDPTLSANSSSFALSPDGKVVFCCGFWDSSFKSFSTENGSYLQSMFGHRDLVTCVAITDLNISIFTPVTRLGDAILATGSRDATVCVWEWNSKAHKVTGVNGKHASPRSVITGHVEQVDCVAVNGDQGCVLSASRNNSLLLHKITGELLRKIEAPSHYRIPANVLITPQCQLVVHFADKAGCLAVYNCTGDMLQSQELQEQVIAMVADREGEYLITGGYNLTPVVRSISSLSPVLRLAPSQSAISSLALSADQRFLVAGMTQGSVSVYPVDFRRLAGSTQNSV